jgi:hypothetical protein
VSWPSKKCEGTPVKTRRTREVAASALVMFEPTENSKPINNFRSEHVPCTFVCIFITQFSQLQPKGHKEGGQLTRADGLYSKF